MTRIFFILFLCCDFNRALGATAIQSDANRKDQKPPSEGFAEYFLDHQVSEKQARDSLLHMNSDAFVNPAHCKPCTHEEKQYCKSENLLKDHCCCNQGHRIEQLYFIPHTCYIDEKRCQPSRSCLTVIEIRNCCCDAQLKRHWKSRLSNAKAIRSSKYLWLLLAMLLAVFG